MAGRIDDLLEDIDQSVVAVLQEIVLSGSDPQLEVTPLLRNLSHDFGLFTLPQIRTLR